MPIVFTLSCQGRPLLVREDREDFSPGGAGFGLRLFVGNLPWHAQWFDLKVLQLPRLWP